MFHKVVFTQRARNAAGNALGRLEAHARRLIAWGYARHNVINEHLPRWGFYGVDHDGVSCIAWFSKDTKDIEIVRRQIREWAGDEAPDVVVGNPQRFGFHAFDFNGVSYIAWFATDSMKVDVATRSEIDVDGDGLVPSGSYSCAIPAS